MKLGAEKRGQVVLLAVLLAAAGILLWFNLASGDGNGDAPVAAITAARPMTIRQSNLDPRLDLEELDRLRQQTYTGTGRDLFHLGPPPPPPISPRITAERRQAAEAAAQRAALTVPPPPPPIPLSFYGFAEATNMPEKVFVRFGGETFVVTQGTTISHRYEIEEIGKVSVRVKDLTTNSEQELPLQQGGSGS